MRLQRVFNYSLNNLLHAWVLQYCNNLQIIVVLHTSPLIPLGMLGSGKRYKQANNLTFHHTYFEGQALVVLQINTPSNARKGAAQHLPLLRTVGLQPPQSCWSIDIWPFPPCPNKTSLLKRVQKSTAKAFNQVPLCFCSSSLLKHLLINASNTFCTKTRVLKQQWTSRFETLQEIYFSILNH